MKVLVVGWYGTETIGDRAILAGLIQLLTKAFGRIELVLGSLYPFFSERSIQEDRETIVKTSFSEVAFSIVNTKDSKELTKAVYDSELVIVGGGPLMDLSELYMVDYAFKLAKKIGRKTAVTGCGVGPLFKRKYRKIVLSIVKNSDVTVLRDSASFRNIKDIFSEFSQDFSKCNVVVGFDPSVHYVYRIYNVLHTDFKNDYISINLRSFPEGYSEIPIKDKVNSKLERFVLSVSESFPDKEILLVPMHYFHIGDDDRYFLNELKFKLGRDNVQVQNEPLSLEKTVGLYANSYFSVGMRFHSIVLQTIASGKNFVLDYTQPNTGKISGFISDIDPHGFYANRYASLQDHHSNLNLDLSLASERFTVDRALVEKSEEVYLSQLKKLN